MNNSLLSPLTRALSQWSDPAFFGAILYSLFWSLLVFVALELGTVWWLWDLLPRHGWLGWLAAVAGGTGAALLGFWLFLPLAALIATLFIERISRAVERRYYPWLPPPRGASVPGQIWDGLALAGRILLFNLLALLLALLLPGLGFMLGWAVAAFAIGRGLFVTVAMRRMPRREAMAVYRRHRLPVLAQGGVLAIAAYLPILNLFIPVIGIAAMVHVLDRALATKRP